MKKSEFYLNFIEFLEIKSIDSVNSNTVYKELEEYDSFFVLSIIALVDNLFSINLSSKQLIEIETIGELMDLIGKENFDN
jgi:acyl carrier protein